MLIFEKKPRWLWLLALAVLAGCGGSETSRSRPNVLLYLVDTLRADRLGCYGYPRPTSPRLDALAAESILFENALASSSWTRSSVASLLTGRTPAGHGVFERDQALAAQAETLAEVLGRAGYATAALMTNPNLGRPFGFAQGFETFTYLEEPAPSRALHPAASAVHQAALAWLDGRSDPRPFFLYLHTMEPHAPYTPSAAAARELAPGLREHPLDEAARAALRTAHQRSGGKPGGEVFELGSMTWLKGLHRGVIAPDPSMVEDLSALYDAELRDADRQLGELLDELQSRGHETDTLVVFVSDHGEEFHDHGGWEHGRTLYQEQLRVPWILRFPDPDLPRGLRLKNPVGLVDLLPTLADFLGLSLPAGVSGISLMPLIRDQRAEPEPTREIYTHLDLDGRKAESLIFGAWKLLCDPKSEGCRLFDLAADPHERVDVAAEHPQVVADLRARLGRARRPPHPLAAAPPDVDPEQLEHWRALREQLRALGYVE